MPEIQSSNQTPPQRAGAPAIFLSARRKRGFRLSALLAALALLAAAPLAPAAHAGVETVQVGSILDSPELFEVFNAGASPRNPRHL